MKVEEIYDAYLDALDEYIGDEIVIPGIYSLHVLVKFKKHKQDTSGNLIG